jgi:hypothetical protein
MHLETQIRVNEEHNTTVLFIAEGKSFQQQGTSVNLNRISRSSIWERSEQLETIKFSKPEI